MACHDSSQARQLVLAPLVAGLAYLHRLGVIHRDIKVRHDSVRRARMPYEHDLEAGLAAYVCGAARGLGLTLLQRGAFIALPHCSPRTCS